MKLLARQHQYPIATSNVTDIRMICVVALMDCLDTWHWQSLPRRLLMEAVQQHHPQVLIRLVPQNTPELRDLFPALFSISFNAMSSPLAVLANCFDFLRMTGNGDGYPVCYHYL